MELVRRVAEVIARRLQLRGSAANRTRVVGQVLGSSLLGCRNALLRRIGRRAGDLVRLFGGTDEIGTSQ